MSEKILYVIPIALSLLGVAIIIYGAILYELRKAQKIWREKRK